MKRLLAGLAALVACLALATSTLMIGDFSNGLEGWRERSFSGNTRYRIVDLDGETVLEAVADGSASALYRTERIDLRHTPYLHWRWRVADIFEETDELTRSGDDYPARIYVVQRRGLTSVRLRIE